MDVPVVKQISVQGELEAVCRRPQLTVVYYLQPWCTVCQALKPELEGLAREYDPSKVTFVCVDGEAEPDGQTIHDEVEPPLEAYPTFIMYMGGRVVHRGSGFYRTKLKNKVNELVRLVEFSASAPTPVIDSRHEDEDESDDDLYACDEGPERAAPVAPKVVYKEVYAEAEFKEDDGEGDDDLDITAALEEACGELGYSEEEVEAFLNSGDYPEELVALIMSKTGCEDKARVVEAMNKERMQFLEKIQASIVEKKRVKSAAEAKVQAKLKRIGKCPMNYEWIKCEGGYRCAGGSHWVDDSQVNVIEG